MEDLAAVIQTTFRFGELESVLADINEIPSVQRTSFQARLKDIQRHGLLRMDTLPRGKAAAYGLRELALLAIAVEMCQFGVSTKQTVEVMLSDEYPMWMAVLMAAQSIEQRPEVFNAGPGDTGNPAEQEMWGFSPDWNDNQCTDPFSMFLYFDPSVLSPWGRQIDGSLNKEGELIASATFFYAGMGVVAESLPRWTTGPTRRLAFINVTKLLFDLAAHIAGTDGLAVCKGFAAAADAEITRGDFDLNAWLAHVAKSAGMQSVARTRVSDDLGMKKLEELLSPSDEPLGRYIVSVPQVMPEGKPWDKDQQRPDMIIRLPGQRELRVDDKVSLMHDIPQASIEGRLQELAEKPYHTQFADRTDWTVLYVEDENSFASAVAVDNDIIDRALAQNVLLATPTILLKLLAEVDGAWAKYREEFPDLGNDEWEGLRDEHRPWLELDYEPSPNLPFRIPYAERKTTDGDR